MVVVVLVELKLKLDWRIGGIQYKKRGEDGRETDSKVAAAAAI